MYDTILLPTDGSEGMQAVIDHANELAQIHDATIHAVYVLDTATMSHMPMDTSWEAVSDLLHTEAEHALEEVEEATDEDVPVETTMVEGTPSREIVNLADEVGADVIVMGTHGRGGLDRLLLGSVAERVIRTAPMPVTTVKVDDTLAASDDT